ncbi:hypothetical protein MUP77_17645 [Candidatus Bathyarchaeota archaeon]|nr:hypothetical protein [Candidatus Bathyarchaeota archaeon]
MSKAKSKLFFVCFVLLVLASVYLTPIPKAYANVILGNSVIGTSAMDVPNRITGSNFTFITGTSGSPYALDVSFYFWLINDAASSKTSHFKGAIYKQSDNALVGQTTAASQTVTKLSSWGPDWITCGFPTLGFPLVNNTVYYIVAWFDDPGGADTSEYMYHDTLTGAGAHDDDAYAAKRSNCSPSLPWNDRQSIRRSIDGRRD